MAKQTETKTTPAVRQKSEQMVALERTIADQVLARVNEFEQTGSIRLPDDYSAANAVKSAWLVLLETEDRNNKPVLEVCSKASIANAMLKMILLGLNPVKKQCDFIAYNGKLNMQIEYHGNIALAKRHGGVKNAVGNLIYEGDNFKYSVDPETGYKVIVQHEQDFENIDMNKIKGAYATLTFKDGSQPYVEIMNMNQIRQAWQQGATKGNSPAHKNFPDQMAVKTVINRACKLFITSSDDGALYDDDYNKEDELKKSVKETADENANKIELDISEAEEVNDNTSFPDKQDEPEPAKNPEPEPVKKTTEKAPEPAKNQQQNPPADGRMF
jgi:recombination protein RecT